MAVEIKNLKKAAERIKKAVEQKERIILYGDADLDGVSSVIILKESLQSLGGKAAAIYFPDRATEGYGLTETGLKFLKKFAPALLVVVDCGIGNFKEAELAKKFGFELIIVDHHEILDKLPSAPIIVDPKQKGDNYPFKELAATGIVFKLSGLILGKKMTSALRRSLLELATLATLADMMPRSDDNKELVEEGLPLLEDSFRPGLRVFFEIESFKAYPDLLQKVSKIISILNIRDVKNRLPASFRLLTCSSLTGTKKIVKELLAKSLLRREKIDNIVWEVEKKLAKKNEVLIFEGDSSFELILMSSAASILLRKYQKPVFLFKKMDKESQGTVRMTKGLNSVSLMKKCSSCLLGYGGHPLASGFRIKNDNLDKFKLCLIDNLEK